MIWNVCSSCFCFGMVDYHELDLDYVLLIVFFPGQDLHIFQTGRPEQITQIRHDGSSMQHILRFVILIFNRLYMDGTKLNSWIMMF